MLAVLALFAGSFGFAAASLQQEMEASVRVTLEDMGLEFGSVGAWEASLYSGAEDGQEAGGRFTEWIQAANGEVTIMLPLDRLEEGEIPWNDADNTYVRIRTVGEEPYPTFDLVSDPFTLEENNYWVHFGFDSMNQEMEGTTGSQITVELQDLGGMFGALDSWEASLYAGAVPGEETLGRFTEWVPLMNGEVVFDLPEDVMDGQMAPWDSEAYVRIRSLTDEFPVFDIVGMPFTLTEGWNVTTTMTVFRGRVEASVTVMVEGIGEEFGVIGDWEASLYTGAVEGQETNGSFTEWKLVQDGQVTFFLPVEVRPGQEAPWNDPDNTYVRVRTVGEDPYPNFDLVSDRFTLEMMDYHVHFMLVGMNEPMAGENDAAQITVRLNDMGGEFGALDSWQASLYAGPVPGEETDGRFTEWMDVMNGEVVFNLPEDVMDEEMAPWGEEVYVRIRSLNEEYPEFDLVGMPFTLTEGMDVITTITVERGVEVGVEEEYTLYLPLILLGYVVGEDE